MKRGGAALVVAGATALVSWIYVRRSSVPQETSGPIPTPAPTAAPAKAAALSPSPTAWEPGTASALNSPYAKFQTGDYEGAVQILRVEVARNPSHALNRRNLATSLYALGLQRLREQKVQAAEDLFEESAGLDHKGSAAILANIRLRSGKHVAALDALEDVFEKTGDVLALRGLLDLALSRDDLNRAQAYLNRGESLNPKDPTEKELLETTLADRRKRLEIRRIFSQSEVVVERGIVQVAYANPEKKRTAEMVSKAMDETTEALARWLLPLPEQSRLRAIVLPVETFVESTGAPPWADAIFDGILRIPVPKGSPSSDELARAATVSRHETLHAYLYDLCGHIFPYWLNEGLAQKMEGRPVSSAWFLLRSRYGPRLPETLTTDEALEHSFIDASPNDVPELYARSLLMVDAISRREGNDIWKNILSKTCLDKEPVPNVLTAELGAARGAELWKTYLGPGKNP